MRAEAFVSARCVSLNRPLFTDKVRDDCRRTGVEADHIQHAAIVRIGEGETVGGHPNNDCLRFAYELGTILTQCLRRMDVASPRFAVRIGDERRNVQLVLTGPDHRQRTVRTLEGQAADALDRIVQAHARGDVQRDEPV